MTVEADASAGVSLVASLTGLSRSIDGWCQRMDAAERFKRRAADALRQVPFAGAITLSGGAGTLQDYARFGVPNGYYCSVRRLTAQGFTAGTVTAYIDGTSGEPVMPFSVAAVNTIGKGELLVHPLSQLVFGATGITGTVTIWGAADVFETWLLPFYIGAEYDG